MSSAEFLLYRRARDIAVSAAGDRLRLNAAPDALTPELRAEVAACKAEILRFLAEAGCGGAASECRPSHAAQPILYRSPSGGDRQ
jgi:hypothetical protein